MARYVTPIAEDLLDRLRATRPAGEDGLWNWIFAFTGVRIARRAVCPGHQAPWSMVRDQAARSLPSVRAK